MKKLHLLVLKSYFGPFVMTFFIALFIFLMQFLWKYIDDLVGKGLQWYTIAELLFYASSTFVPVALPLAVLLSSLMTFGNLGERYELVALKSAGISLNQIMKPLAFTAIIISITAFYFSNRILPVANLKMRSLLYDVREQKPAVNIKEGVFYNGLDNYVIRVGSKDKDGKTIYNIMIYDHTDHMGDVNLTIAEWGKMEFTSDKRYLIFNLHNGTNYLEDQTNRKKAVRHPLQRTNFKEQYVRIDLSEFALTRTSEEFFKGNYRMLNLHQLNIVLDSLTRNMTKNKETFRKKYIKENLQFYSKGYAHNTILPVKISQKTMPAIRDTQYEVPNTQYTISANMMDNFKTSDPAQIIEIAIDFARRTRERMFFESEDAASRFKSINKHKIEYHRKFTLSIACLLFFIIGAPIGAIIRRGGFGLPVIISGLFFIIYHVISIIGEKSAREGGIPVYFGMWISTLAILPIGILLAYKSSTDSPILDAESWTRFFRKLHLIRKKLKANNHNEDTTVL